MKENPAIKIIVVGESGVGKTCLIKRFIDNTYSDEGKATIGVDFRSKLVEIQGQTLKAEIWDTAGQEKFNALIPSFYRNALGVILVFDVTMRHSFNKLELWLEQTGMYTSDVVKMIVANKIDKCDREVTKAEGMKYAKKCAALYLECSAKDNIDVTCAFEDLMSKIVLTPRLWPPRPDETSVESFHVNEEANHGLVYNCISSAANLMTRYLMPKLL